MSRRGRHKVFLGMAPGVGKTYQMLEEGHEERDRGRDVVIGYLESHGRSGTLSQAEGLEMVERRRLEYRGATFEEMDLPAILRRRPELCLIDELAHTDVPGCEHAKRYDDVDAVLEAGIDVFSTVNVQHVESLAGQIATLIATEVSETVPDQVLHEADDVVLVDITPALLIERLREGKIYSDQSSTIAERGFFRPQTLARLREISLLHVAEEVEPDGETPPAASISATPASKPVLLAATRPAPTRGRVLALATPDPQARPTVYHAYRTAARLDAPLDVLWLDANESASSDSDETLAALERLVLTLGGTLLLRHGDDLVKVATDVAHERGATYLLIGRPRRKTSLGRLAHRHLPLELMAALPGVDVQIVALP
jgi:two-component system sensor histidine kinase KdpD